MNIRQAWLLALVVFIEVQLPVNGQYLAFPDSNAAWVTLETLGPDPWGEITYYMDPIKQEIVINDTAFIVVHSNPANPGALYDNGFGKIYYHDSLAATTYLIYDYSAQQGDTVNVWATNGGGDFYFWPQIVDTIDAVYTTTGHRTYGQGTGNTIDLIAQPPGVYTAVVATERGRQAVRLVVVR
jgi:hypothetical protein